MLDRLTARVGHLTEPSTAEHARFKQWMTANAATLQAAYDSARALSQIPGRFHSDPAVHELIRVMSNGWTAARVSAPPPPNTARAKTARLPPFGRFP